MRISAATAALLLAMEALAETEPSSENLWKLSRRQLLHQRHRLFPPKLRLGHRSDDVEVSSTKHTNRSKMGNDWSELDEKSPPHAGTTDVETKETSAGEMQQVKISEPNEKLGQDKLSDYVVATEEKWAQVKIAKDIAAPDETSSNSIVEDDCPEQLRRFLAKTDKSGKKSKIETTYMESTIASTYVSAEEAQAESKSATSGKAGKMAKTKGGKHSKSTSKSTSKPTSKPTSFKCQTVPPKPSGKPTVKPSQELPSVTSSPTSSPTPKPTDITPEPSSTSTADNTGSTTSSPSTSTIITDAPVTSVVTTSPTSSPSSEKATESPTGSPSVSTVVTESPVVSVATESPTGSPSASTVVTETPSTSEISEAPSGAGLTNAPTITDSPTTSSATEAPVASVASEAPSASPSSDVTVLSTYAPTTTTYAPTSELVQTEAPVSSIASEAPTASPSSEVTDISTAPSTQSVATEAPVASVASEAPTTSPSSEVTDISTAPSTQSIETEAPVASVASEAPTASPLSEVTDISTVPSIQSLETEAPVTTPTTNAPTGTPEKCTFCEGGIPDPEAVASGTGGQTCAQVKASADEDTNGSDTCGFIQAVESSCCPDLPDSCAFCIEGITNPDLTPGAAGQTCAQIGDLATTFTEVDAACKAIQAEEITCCPQSLDGACAFCIEGIANPDLVHVGGQTCAQIEALAAGNTEGSDTCTIIQEAETTCCPQSQDVACAFCIEGITNPDLVSDSAGQTCAQVGALAAGDTEGTATCTTIQAEESICCPQSSESCVPLDPNPYSFEPPNNVFPKAPWTTGGDGEWTIDDTNAQEGTYSIKSPNLEGGSAGVKRVSNATLAICDDFSGGNLMFMVKAPVIPPYDNLVWFLDGVENSQIAGQSEWRQMAIPLAPGAHRIDFQYQYNPFEVPVLADDQQNPAREGAAWIDAVRLVSFGEQPV